MSMMLPDALAWVLDMVGIDWPNIDEDQLREAADEFRQIAGELDGHAGEAKDAVAQLLGANSADGLDLFGELWDKLANGHLPQFAEAMKLLADALDAGAGLVLALKIGAIAQLAILAAEIIADQAAAPFTFGASEAAIPVEVAATRAIMKGLVDTAVDAVEQQLVNAVEGPVFAALGSAGEELAGQLLGDTAGGDGVDLGKAAAAGGDGFKEGVGESKASLTSSHSG
ncbi:hypothetical protein FPZ12_017995 [Amycolatopsis acidicola]|uniref:Outer membrane channel protein CpnT-like N-terminal domain-containing protein n=1 Tax=Amycolatopsis acidicola TaxID=2596893 RepID=A0A5N0V1A4_9PSEU|nr:hypothetical protein [Amycolatopsis acidicola]KAA9160239.1 hypothetical protein FPZ12_017995 [Amycolatopsis acidicola]